MKIVRVKLSPEAEEVYKHLNKEAPTSKTERMILKSINQKVELIKTNPHYGDPIGKDKIPEEYLQKYTAKNLFRVELPAFVLDVIDHKEYDKKFGYKK